MIFTSRFIRTRVCFGGENHRKILDFVPVHGDTIVENKNFVYFRAGGYRRFPRAARVRTYRTVIAFFRDTRHRFEFGCRAVGYDSFRLHRVVIVDVLLPRLSASVRLVARHEIVEVGFVHAYNENSRLTEKRFVIKSAVGLVSMGSP